jgi:hypothetical protein
MEGEAEVVPKLPDFLEMVPLCTKGCGTNTRAISMAILWAGERIATAIENNRETHAVHEMAHDLGKAFVESMVPPAPVPGVTMPKRRTSIPPKKKT